MPNDFSATTFPGTRILRDESLFTSSLIPYIRCTFVDAYLPVAETSKRYVEQDDEEGFPRGGGSKGAGDVSQSNALRRLAHVSAHVSAKRTPCLVSLCKEALQITPCLPNSARCHGLELIRQSLELTPGTAPTIVAP